MNISTLSVSKFAFVLLGLIVISFSSCKQDEMIELTNEQELTIDGQNDLVENKYIVVFNDDYLASSKRSGQVFTDRTAKSNFTAAHRTETTPKIEKFLRENTIEESRVIDMFTAAFTGFTAELTPQEAEALRNNPNVEGVEQDRMITLDAISEKGGDSDISELDRFQIASCGVTAAGGPGTGPSYKWIWIIDTGIDLDHPDLNVVTSYAKAFAGGTAQDCHGHGSHVAGLAAAKNNFIGVVGVSAGANVVPVKVFPNCKGKTALSSIINGINYVAQNDIPGDVVNISIGGYYGANCSNFSSYINAIAGLANNGTRVAIAAGNESANAAVYQPACVNMANVYTVAAMNCNGTFASSYSNWNMDPIDYIASGSNLYSCDWNGSYRLMTGTSMASPIVAGILHARQAAPKTSGFVLYNYELYPKASR